MRNRVRLIANAAIAAVIGSTIGALAGVWSAHRVTPVDKPAAQVAATKTIAASSPASPGVKAMGPASGSREPGPATRVAAPPASTGAGTTGADNLLERARVLAQRPDVKALIALRESVVLRATTLGEQGSPATKAQLDGLDRYLDEARELRLKIDAAEFQKSAPESTAAHKPPVARP